MIIYDCTKQRNESAGVKKLKLKKLKGEIKL